MIETRDLELPENRLCPEIPRIEPGETGIFFQRHGRYDNRRPEDENNLTEEARQSHGRLTQEGRVEAGEVINRRIITVFETEPENTDILVVVSPTFWIDSPDLGQRAVETGEIISQKVVEYLKIHGLSTNQLLNCQLRKDNTPRFRNGFAHQDEKLGEGRLFQVLEFANYLRKKYEGQGSDFWKNYFADADEVVRRGMQAEGPADAAARLGRVMDIEARYARIYHHFNPGRKLFIWNVTHGDGLTPFVERVIRVPRESFEADYNEGIGTRITKDGKASANFQGNEYRVSVFQPGQKQSSLTPQNN